MIRQNQMFKNIRQKVNFKNKNNIKTITKDNNLSDEEKEKKKQYMQGINIRTYLIRKNKKEKNIWELL